jgi:hypothetical protein
MAVALDCFEREVWGEDYPWSELWESLEPFIDKDGKPLLHWNCLDKVQQQYARRCVQIEKLKIAAGAE